MNGDSAPLGLRTVIHHVPDLSRARAFYSEAFGAQPYFDEPFYVGFRIGGFELGLDPDMASGTAGAGGTIAYWGVSSLELTVDRMLNAGASSRVAAREVGDGIRMAVIADPFGNEIGLIENPHFNTAAVR